MMLRVGATKHSAIPVYNILQNDDYDRGARSHSSRKAKES